VGASRRSGAGDAPAERLRELLVRRLDEKRFVLPLLPATASRVVQSCSDDGGDARELAALVQADVSLAANVLRIANSAVYAAREPIVSLPQAISRLGLATLCSIALSAAVKTEVFRVAGWEAWLGALWTHSTRAGAWAKEIARARRKNVEGAFLGGLMHDVGRALILREASELARREGVPLSPEEVEAWTDALHARVGADLLETWALPAWAVAAVREHHACLTDPSAGEDAFTVALADALAHALPGGEPTPEVREELERHPALRPLGIYADELDALLERRPEVERLVEALA
jgi:HD-like signal output (HDOD) protein